MSATVPDDAVANFLNGKALGNFTATLNTNLFRGAVRPADPAGGIPDPCIFALATGGPPPMDYFPAGGSQPSIRQSNVQVRIRGAADDMGDTTVSAQAVLDALHLATLDLTGFIACKSLSASPNYLGRDDTEHPEYSVNVTVWYEK